MTTRRVRHMVHGRATARRTAFDAAVSRGLLTWWELMSDLDPGWLDWRSGQDEGEQPHRLPD